MAFVAAGQLRVFGLKSPATLKNEGFDEKILL
jgi:hypothetical protein